MNRLIILGIAVIAVIYIFVSSIFVVNEREQAIVMRFGQITDVKTEPGLYFKLPTNFVDTVQIIEDRLLRYDIANMTVQVKDGKFYIVDAFITYRISDPRLFRARALGELRVVEDRISSRFDASLRQVYGLRDFTEALSEQRPAMMREARDLIRPDMAQLGVEIVDVRILRTDLDPSVSADTFNRMRPSVSRKPHCSGLGARKRRRPPAPSPIVRPSRCSLRHVAMRKSCEARAMRSGARSSPAPTTAIPTSSTFIARCSRTVRRWVPAAPRWCCRRTRSSSGSSKPRTRIT